MSGPWSPQTTFRDSPKADAAEIDFNVGMTTIQHAPRPNAAAFSLPSILAIIAALTSFVVGPGAQLLLAIAALVLGALGCVLALLPGVRGGLISLVSLLAGGLGFLIAIVRIIASIG